MINLRVKQSDLSDDLFDVEFVVDTGTTVATVSPGLVYSTDVEQILNDLEDQIRLIRERVC